MTVSFDLYRPGIDDAEVLALRSEVWGADHPHTSSQFLEWLYQRNPAGRGTGVILRSEGRPIGFSGINQRLMTWKGETVHAAHGVEYMVSPAVSGGLSGRYALRIVLQWNEVASSNGNRFGFSFPNPKSLRIQTSPRTGWKQVFSPSLFVRVLRTIRFVEPVIPAVPPAVATVLARGFSVWQSLRRGRHPRPPGAPKRIECFDERCDELWEKVRPSIIMGECRNAAYLNWRYRDHPLYRYAAYGWELKGELVALVVTTRRTLFGIPSLLIVDMLPPHGGDGAVTALLDHILAEARQEGVQIAGALAPPSSALAQTLRVSGFASVPKKLSPKPFVLVAHTLGHPDGLESNPDSWYLTWGDTDVV
jgi:hypothetical protein